MDSSLSSSTSSSSQRSVLWALAFDNLLADHNGLRVFQEFLEQEFSQENLNFWMECQKLRRQTSPKEIRKLVKAIHRCYFAPSARQEINVDSEARAAADADILRPSSTAFTEAEVQVYNLMKEDSYVRFLKSELYAQQVKADISKAANRKEYGLVSWYKSSVKPRLSISSGKPPALLPSRRPAPPLPDPAVLLPAKCLPRPLQCLPPEKNSTETVQTAAIQGSEQRSQKENVHSNVKTGTWCDNDLSIPDSLWQLSDENEYEEFFCDLLTASHTNPSVVRAHLGRRSNSHPSLADTIAQVNLPLHPSSSLDNVLSSLPNVSRTRAGLSFRSPPPPLPPKSARRVQPLPPPPPPPAPGGASRRRTLRV